MVDRPNTDGREAEKADDGADDEYKNTACHTGRPGSNSNNASYGGVGLTGAM